MNFGFNSNVRVGNDLYHVQTEDRGPAHPFLDTVVYLSGRVVYKRSVNYEKYTKGIAEKNLAQWLRDRVSQQHRDVIAELEAGKLPLHGKQGATETVARNEDASATLDLRLQNSQSWYAAGNVTLEVELREADSTQSIRDAEVQVYLERETERTPCAEARTDANGCATLRFPMPRDVAEGSSLVIRAAEGQRYGEVKFRLKSKPRDNTPAPVSR